MIADIIPTKKLPRSLSVLSYKIPVELENQIKIGQLVNMPLRNSQTQGIIIGLRKKQTTPYKLKNISNLVHPTPIFTSQQLKLFNNLADYYATSASLFVHFNLPKLIKKDWLKLPNKLESKTNRQKPVNQYFWWSKTEQRREFYLRQIKLNQQKKQHVLLIVPRIKDIYQLARELGIENNFIAVHRQLSRRENFNAWLKAMNKQAYIFIGTRSALFYPYSQLGILIVDEENSIDHKQYDMNPHYDVYTVSQTIQKIYNCHVYYASYAPSVKLFHLYQPQSRNKKKYLQQVELINIHHLLASKNYTFISDRLLTHLKAVLKQKKIAFIFINHKGEARLTKCDDCGYSFNCPHCRLPLIKQNNQLVCYYCQYQEESPPFCPHCHGPRLKHSGLGVQKIARQLKQLLPSVLITVIDKNTSQAKIEQSPNPQIIVGTQFALDKINWPQIKLIGIINADQLWQHAEFMAAEQAYQLLTKILTLTPQNAKIVLQTFSPQHSIIKALTNRDPLLFYRPELAIRKNFDYPPYINLIKISCLNKKKDKALKQAEKVYQVINNLARQTQITITPPVPILRNKIRGKYKFNLIVKLKKLSQFKRLVNSIPADCLIDIHPIKLLD